jgi:hypothetical protein
LIFIRNQSAAEFRATLDQVFLPIEKHWPTIDEACSIDIGSWM